MSSVKNSSSSAQVSAEIKRENVWNTTKTVVIVVGVVEIFIAIRLLFGPILPPTNTQIVSRNNVYDRMERPIERESITKEDRIGGGRGSMIDGQRPTLR